MNALDEPYAVDADPVSKRIPWLPRAVWWAVLLLILGGYLAFAHQLIYRTNQQPQAQDQKHNMRRSLAARDQLANVGAQGINQAMNDWLPHLTDGVVSPFWPWVAARVAAPDHRIEEATFKTDTKEDLQFFARGKWLNVGCSALALLCLALFLRKEFTPLPSLVCLLLTAFGAFLPRAVYFQPEPLFYAFFLAAWIMGIKLLRCNTLWAHAGFGLACGLAYITKSSIEPLMLGWFACTVWRWLTSWGRCRLTTAWCGRQHFLGCLVVLIAYGAVVGPTLCYNQQKFGSALHNYPRYWMWMDDFDKEGYAWMQQHGDAAKLAAMPADEIPNAKNYLKRNPYPQWFHRLADGTEAKLTQLFAPKPEWQKPKDGWKRLLDLRGWYLAALALPLVLMGTAAWLKQRRQLEIPPLLTCDAGLPILFVSGLVFAYALAFGWYHPIGRGERFMLMLYAPLAISLVWGLEKLRDWQTRCGTARWCRWLIPLLYILIIAAILCRLARLWLDKDATVWMNGNVL